ncbi:MAG: PDZ domain-containing protein [Clostridia bacterium]|nr:PDZ domain-containing protein [Clostridia bacterium]
MRKRLSVLIVTVFLIFAFFVPANAAELDEFSIVNQVSFFVEQSYKFGATSVQLKNKALEYMLSTGDTSLDNVLDAMFKGLDDYSVYFTEEEYKAFLGDVNSSLCGIGVSVVAGREGMAVIEVIPFSPAEKAGIKMYDTIVSAGDINLAGMTVSDATKYMKGIAGTSVKIGVKRYGTEDVIYFDIVRANVEISPISWRKLDDETAYISISTLTANADVFMKEALKEIDALGIEKIVLDLRDNPGGNIVSTVNICEMFMPEGPVAYVDYKDPAKMETYYSENKNPKYSLAVLINGNTASGAELLSGGLQDTKRGVIFGETSFGKGTVQTVKELVNGGAIKLTIAKYYTAGKQDVAKDKIVPDFEVKNSYKQLREETFNPLDFETEFKVGSKGRGVLAIEERLVVLGYMEEADESFTEETMDAVRRFKAYNGMGTEPVVNFDFIAFINNIEYDKQYIEVDRQLEAAHNYLKGLEG